MDNSRNISGNTLKDNVILNQGNFDITVNAGKRFFSLLGTSVFTVAHPLPGLLGREEKIPPKDEQN